MDNTKEIESLAHKWIEKAEEIRKEREWTEGECTFEQAAVGMIFVKLAEFEYRLRAIEAANLMKKKSGDQVTPNNPPTEKTGIEYFLDAKENKVYKRYLDGRIEDVT